MANRQANGQFKAGHTATKGNKRKCTMPMPKRILLANSEEIVTEGIRQAIEGENPALMTWFCKRFLKNHIDEGGLKLPQGSTAEKSQAIVEAIGTIDTQQLDLASRILRQHAELTEVQALSDRITQLEERHD